MPERSERVVLAVGVAVALAHAAFFLVLSLQRAAYPFELEWMEGGSLEHVMRVLRGEPLYVAPSLDFVPFPYPPLYYGVSALFLKVLGPGLPALRTVSLLATLGSAALIARFVQRESASTAWGLICAGLFLATWRASGLYFDIARLDALFTFLLLAGLYALRFASGLKGWLWAALLATSCVMTKQTGAAVFAPLALWCIWADWRENGGDFSTLLEWKRTRGYALPLLALALLGTAALELRSGHFLRYVIAVQPGHAIKWGMLGWFFWWDLLLTVPAAAIAVGAWLGTLGPTGEARSRDEERSGLFYGVALFGVLVACIVPRIKVGGAANNLIPTYAWMAVLFGVAVSSLRARAERSPVHAPGAWLRSRFALVVAVAALLQLLVLVRWPQGYLPTEADRAAGEALAARVARVEGEVLMPVQGYLAGAAGRRVFAHQMPVADYLASGLADAPALRASYEEAIASQRFAAVVDSNTAFLRRMLPDGFLERHYELAGWLFEDASVLLPVSGARIRAGTLWVPRAPAPGAQRQREAR